MHYTDVVAYNTVCKRRDLLPLLLLLASTMEYHNNRQKRNKQFHLARNPRSAQFKNGFWPPIGRRHCSNGLSFLVSFVGVHISVVCTTALTTASNHNERLSQNNGWERRRTDAFVTRKNVSKQLSNDNGKHLDGRSLLCIHAYTRTMIVWLSCASKLAQTAIDLLGTGERAEPETLSADWITGADTDKYLPGPSAVVIPHLHRLYCVRFCVGNNLREIFSPKEIRHLWRRVNNEATDTVYCCLYPSRNNLNF